MTISLDETGTITGGGGVNTLTLSAIGSTYTLAKTGANVSGFQTLISKPAAGSTSSIALTNFPNNTFTALTAFGGSGSSTTFTAVTPGTPLTISPIVTTGATTTNTTGTVVYNTSDYAGMSGTVTVNLTGAQTGTIAGTTITKIGNGTQGTVTTALTLADGAGNGIGTVNIVTNGTQANSTDVITTLTDTFMSTLNITGTANLIITNYTAALPALTISDNTNNTGTTVTVTASSITNFTNPASFSSLSYSGTHAFTFGDFGVTDTAAAFTISNANTGTTGVLTTGSITLSAATSITLKGSVATTTGKAITAQSTSGVTVSGATDNSAVILSLTGAVSGKTDTITLGNGNNTITDTSTAGNVNITVGTGYNTITVGQAAVSTLSATITLGAHTSSTAPNIDAITMGPAGTYYASQPSLIVTGIATNDTITFASGFGTTVTSVAAGPTLATTITALQANNNVWAYSVFGGNTYIYNGNNANPGGGADFIELIGNHTFTAATGVITIAS